MYLMAVKPFVEHRAYFLDPVLLPGGESYENWQHALSTIPSAMNSRIKAFVSDGFRTAATLAEENGWIHQRCHFHLIAYLQVRRGRRKQQIAGATVREMIYQAIMQLLSTQDLQSIRGATTQLQRAAGRPDCPRSLRMVAAEFLRALPEFRAYLQYPEWHLPTTTGTVEAMCKLIRKRAGTVRTAKSLILWATALIRLKSPITCNGKVLQN